MDHFEGRVALVTGAASGIGKAVVKKLLHYGMIIAACDKDGEGIAKLISEINGIPQGEERKKKTVVPYISDLRKEDEILSMFKNIKETFGGVDICITAAGLNLDAPLLSGESEKWRIMLDVNVMASALCAREAISQMRSCDVKDGHVVLIGSMAGHRVRPSKFNKHFYCTTKYAVTALTEGLRNELAEIHSSIRVSQISPGLVQTHFHDNCFPDRTQELEQLFSSGNALQATDVADAVIYALSAPPHVQVHDIWLRPTGMP